MNKIDKMELSRRIRALPAFAGLTILVFGTIFGVLLINRSRQFQSLALSITSPKFIRVGNTGSSSFVVSWTTEEKNTGAVSFGETPSLGEIKIDFRDQGVNPQKYFTHLVVIDNLKPSTKYFYKIISGGKTHDNANKAFEITTAPFAPTPDSDIAQGRVLTPDGQPGVSALVYLSLANTITQIALTDSNGYWMIPLSSARTVDLKNYSNYDRTAQVEEISIQTAKQTAFATTTTGNDNPVPDIILGQTYNFLNTLPETTITPSIRSSDNSQKSGFSSQGADELSIIFPSENEEVNSLMPEFIGTGPKTEKISIEVNSENPITVETNIAADGKWRWSPTVPLTPGEHSIVVSYTDDNGFLKKITRQFKVLAAGTSDLPSFTATPSGQKSTPTPAISTPVPTQEPTATSTPTQKPVRTTMPSTESGVPASGITSPTFFFLGAGILTLVAGVILVFF